MAFPMDDLAKATTVESSLFLSGGGDSLSFPPGSGTEAVRLRARPPCTGDMRDKCILLSGVCTAIDSSRFASLGRPTFE